MRTYLISRVLQAVIVLVVVSVVVFVLIRLTPGDPATFSLGNQSTPELLAQARKSLGLDQPIVVQYLIWIRNTLEGDFGVSFYSRKPVSQLIMQALPATMQLTLAGMLIALLIALPTGIISAVRQYSALDYGLTMLALVGISLPGFWLGLLMIMVFSLWLRWLPSAGFVPLAQDPGGSLVHTLMPALSLGLILAATTMRFVRSAMLDVVRQDYIRTARAKGLSERLVIGRHALKNALIPTVTVIGLQFGYLLGGTVVIETIFTWPGMGSMAVQAISQRDYAVVQGVVLWVAAVFVLLNLVIDVLYAWLDPRIRFT